MKHSLWALGLGAALALVGCATEDQGTGDAGDDAPSGMDATMDVQPPRDSGMDRTTPPDSGMDAGMDATPTDAGDGGVTDGGDAGDAGDGGLAPPGSPCNVPNAIENEACGICGKRYRACLPGGDGGYAWGAWGYCQGEVVNGCDPKLMYADTDCGNCGKKKQICLNTCAFDLTQQCVEPMNACKPGNVEFQLGLSCDAGGRERTCQNNCQYTNWGSCQACPAGVPVPALGQTTTLQLTLAANQKIARISTGTCPVSSVTSTQTSYVYQKFTNTTNQTAKVSIWHSAVTTNLDTVIAAYAGCLPPDNMDTNARRACLTYANDDCNDSNGTPTPCVSFWAGIMVGDGRQITIPPGESINVYNAALSGSTSGDFKLSIRTDLLQ